MDAIISNMLRTLIERQGSTFLDVHRLLDPNDTSLREEVIRTSNFEHLKDYWSKEYPSYSSDARLPITTRLTHIIGSTKLRNMLCNPQSSLNFRWAMDSKKIMLFNLSDGLIGLNNSQFLGRLIVSQFQIATMGRADQHKSDRVPFYLYIDEFNTFCGASKEAYSRLLSRGRKHNLSLILAHQQTHQLPVDTIQEILGNVSTKIAFNISHIDASRIGKELGLDTDQFKVLTEQPKGTCCIKIGTSKPLLLKRTYKADKNPDHDYAKIVIERSRERYGVPIDQQQPAPSPVVATKKHDQPKGDPQDIF